jgi:hyperosmotically inducible protein
MKPVSTLCSVIALALFTVACGQTDAGITADVKTTLAADDTVKAYQIDVDTQDHVVTLSGNVASVAAKERAVALARNTDGVQNVIDNITVAGGSAALPGEYNTSATGQTAEGEAREGAAAIGETASDAALTASVKSKLLANDTVDGLKIDVDSENGVVTLTGTVSSTREKTEAVRIARATEGVKTVQDKLVVNQ